MTGPLARRHTTTDLVAVAWIASIPGLVADGVASQLPADENKWAANGFIVVPTSVGGSPMRSVPVHMPVIQVECWGTVPGSAKLPWGIPDQLAAQIYRGTLDRTTFGRLLNITAGGLTYPSARVKSAEMLTEPRRIWHDTGDYAGKTFDLKLTWIAQGEDIP